MAHLDTSEATPEAAPGPERIPPCSSSFRQAGVQPGEQKTWGAIAITVIAMGVEIAAGLAYGSMALLADGVHMAGHAAALGIAAFAYVYARKCADDRSYSFGVGKINALGGYTSAVILGVFAFGMVWESGHRLLDPKPIRYELALGVAVFGLLVNLAAAWMLRDAPAHLHGHSHGPEGSDGPDQHAHDHDHNLRAAYMHVLADALTSVLAIFALLAGLAFGASWLDPVMGLVGAVVVSIWALGLLKQTSAVLLDREAEEPVRGAIQSALEGRQGDVADSAVADLHVWRIGPQLFAVEAVIESAAGLTPDAYRQRIPDGLPVAHATIEVRAHSGAS
ncbi:MAG: CDF family Co(II)/Ni(II) efflux transporter DmeF [Pseudomonadota bacterium]